MVREVRLLRSAAQPERKQKCLCIFKAYPCFCFSLEEWRYQPRRAEKKRIVAYKKTIEEKRRSMKKLKEKCPEEETHDLDYCEIDDLDEISGDQQLAFIWCNTHEQYEWHWIDRYVE